MITSQDQKRLEIIEKITQKISENLPRDIAPVICKFVKNFYENVSLEDFENHTISDLYSAVLSFWNFAYEADPNEIKIRVYNPDFEQHGWESAHTIIEIIQRDMPFLVDSVIMAINQFEIVQHLIIHNGGVKIKRDAKNKIIDVLKHDEKNSDQLDTALIFVEISKQTDLKILNELTETLYTILQDVWVAVEDWEQMRQRVVDARKDLEGLSSRLDKTELHESVAFLDWLVDNHFTFLGVRDYKLVNKEGDKALEIISGSGLGVLRDNSTSNSSRSLASMTPEARKLTLSPSQILIISKTNTLATVHRPTYTDYIGIKQFDEKGQVIGERRVIGLFTSIAYNSNPKTIPFLRKKIDYVMKKSNLKPSGHAAKSLEHILNTFPRNDLFQAGNDELYELAMGIFYMQERRRTRLFIRQEVFGKFVSCLVYVPRDVFNTRIRLAIQEILGDEFHSTNIEFYTYFSESILTRIHYVIHIQHKIGSYDVKAIERKIIEVTRSWEDDLNANLVEYFGEEQGNHLANKYKKSFPAGYVDAYTPRTAVHDIAYFENIKDEYDLELNVYKPVDDLTNKIHFKIYNIGRSIFLSEVVPILENMGLKVLNERPYKIALADGRLGWLHDFEMELLHQDVLDLTAIKNEFQHAFKQIWFKVAENDKFNTLVLRANLTWREVSIFRAYAKYLQQIGFTFSQSYIEEACLNHTEIIKKLIELFHLRLSPHVIERQDKDITQLKESIIKSFDQVSNLDEDRILRRILDLIFATLRTNYYQTNHEGLPKSYISFKFKSKAIPEMPLPIPQYEVFVYSPRFEAIHLRNAKVARGGLRWSDRREDFRTEVLGLMKAQVVKNAVIVPSGAKGGFVPKCLPQDGSREEIYQEGIACYKNFIRGLLDITDNKVNGEIVSPPFVVKYDDDDPYLVVAADKGTATFSDIANSISEEYSFWLGDAFASGGSTGYDHKKIGITARGAWESVKRHFRELEFDIQTQPFTVIGIGDMAGDVFGNGLLLSKNIKLIAAFNHMHIFIDPNPDPEVSFKERQRMFNLARSTWLDYNASLISTGGGIYNRKDKSITISPEAQKALGVDKDKFVPNELIRAILKAPVDLLWNGGIGTFFKASMESHLDVGDRTNDAIRLNANDLRCKLVAEGGNLGFTQKARVEYALHGGKINTDFIDNSAGVDCSDHEVNIKILLNDIITNGEMTTKQRNELLAEMTEEVSALVLRNNYKQTQAISLAAEQASRNIELHTRYISHLEESGKIVREIEHLPDTKTLIERKLNGLGLLRPCIAILLSYSKTILNEDILQSNIPEDPYFFRMLAKEFPTVLTTKYTPYMKKHSLRREIISTQLSNDIINDMSFTFIYRMHDETGASVPAIVRAYCTIKEIFQTASIWKTIEELDNKLPASLQHQLMINIMRLMRRSTRWLLRFKRHEYSIEEMTKHFQQHMGKYIKVLPKYLCGEDLKNYQETLEKSQSQGLPETLAQYIAASRALQTALDVIDAANSYNVDLEALMKIYFALNDLLHLGWLRSHIISQKVESRWDQHSREAIRDDLDWQQRQLAIAILKLSGKVTDIKKVLAEWSTQYDALVKRWNDLILTLKASEILNFTIMFVVIRELSDLAQTSYQKIKA